MSESKVMAETLRQRQNYLVHVNGGCTWDNFKEIIEPIGKEQKFELHMVGKVSESFPTNLALHF